MKEKDTRKSKGVAFILYLNHEDAEKCIKETNEKEVSWIELKIQKLKNYLCILNHYILEIPFV